MLPTRYFELHKMIEAYLATRLPAETTEPMPIHQAMRYSLFAGGKRLRPSLCLMVTETLGGKPEEALPLAAAIEMIHTYSLIHDDLPSMDNDDFRRGKPTCHKVFGEAIAILAGDALLTSAFEVLSTAPYDAVIRCGLIADLTAAIGTRGMIGGQVFDIQSEGKILDRVDLERLHGMKTAALIGFSAKSPAVLLRKGQTVENALNQYGQSIGLAFQIIDDVLDIEGTTEILGKTAGKDRQQKKVTYPSLIGLEESRRLAAELIEAAITTMKPFDHFEYLAAFGNHVLTREK